MFFCGHRGYSEDKYSVINTYDGYRDKSRSAKVLCLKEKDTKRVVGAEDHM